MASQQTDVENDPAVDDTVVIEAVAESDGDATAQPELADDGRARAVEVDDSELRAQYRAWRESSKAAGSGSNVDEQTIAAEARPIPRRPGRGTYDPDAAERARAYKYSRRRRSLLFLLLAAAGFTVTALTLSEPKLWIGAGVAGLLLVLFLAYLRRQVRIEADIRERRLAKLERARQIRPERLDAAAPVGDPYAQRTPRAGNAPGPVHHRGGRTVVDLDDDDPGFDDLEQYETMEYRRAVGQ